LTRLKKYFENRGYFFGAPVLIMNQQDVNMRKMLFGLMFLAFFSACSNDGKTKTTIDSIGKKFDSSAEKIWDSTKVKAKNLGERIKEKFNERDSIHRKDSL
jgi:hypothetical protein